MASKTVVITFEQTPTAGVPVAASVVDPNLGIWPSPGVPTHPIYYPPGIWGPTDPRPGWGLPPPVGIWPGPGPLPLPTPPIYYPPGFWGPNDPRPTHPIVIPPPPPIDVLPPLPDKPGLERKVLWSPETGWIVVYVPTGPTPTPSR